MPDLRSLNDSDICAEIGRRIRHERLRQNLTQESLASQAGVALRTYKRFESAGRTNLETLVAILRVLNRLRLLDVALPAAQLPSHETVIQRVERLRQRARNPKPHLL